jgi:hypothetical protein
MLTPGGTGPGLGLQESPGKNHAGLRHRTASSACSGGSVSLASADFNGPAKMRQQLVRLWLCAQGARTIIRFNLQRATRTFPIEQTSCIGECLATAV